jgi:hypothetical protein
VQARLKPGKKLVALPAASKHIGLSFAIATPEHRRVHAPDGALLTCTSTEIDTQEAHLVELVVVILILGDLVEELDALLDEILLDDLEDLVLLEHLAGDVERQVLRVHDALHEAEPLGDELLTIVHDEHPPHVQLDVVGLLPARY